MAGRLEEAGILAIVRLKDGARTVEAGHALASGGVEALEVSLTTPGALEAVERLRSSLSGAVSVGVGTVISEDDARSAAAAGASFGVTPAVRPDAVRALKAEGLGAICGATTPTEILAAHESGADMVKVFPAQSAGGPAYLREVLAPLPWVKLVPTGGVGLEDVRGYFQAGASMLGVGSALVAPSLIEEGDLEALRDLAASFIETWASARESG